MRVCHLNIHWFQELEERFETLWGQAVNMWGSKVAPSDAKFGQHHDWERRAEQGACSSTLARRGVGWTAPGWVVGVDLMAGSGRGVAWVFGMGCRRCVLHRSCRRRSSRDSNCCGGTHARHLDPGVHDALAAVYDVMDFGPRSVEWHQFRG